MDRKEALVEAQLRWGDKAWVSEASHHLGGGIFVPLFQVGDDPHKKALGAGESYEAAFADADKRGAK